MKDLSKRTHLIKAYLDDSEYEKFCRMAKDLHRTNNALVRDLLRSSVFVEIPPVGYMGLWYELNRIRINLNQIAGVAHGKGFIDHDEDAFAKLLEQKTNKDASAESSATESALAVATARSNGLLRLYERVYEDNVNGKVTDEWFMQLSRKYENEQEELKKQLFDLSTKLDRLNTAQASSDNFIRAVRKFMEMQTITPIILHEWIDKIEVFPIEVTGKNRTQRLVIHYRFVGCIDLPSIVPKPNYKLDSRQGVAIEYFPSAG